MKKYCYYAGMLAAGMIAFSSCSKDEEIINPNQPGAEEEAAQEIILQVANTGDGLTTKAGRPLFSSEAKQSIDKVKVYIVNESNNIVSEKEFTNWSTDAVSQIYSTGGHGRQTTWKLKGDERLSPGETYMVYAVGYTSQNSIYDTEIQAYEGLSTTFSKFISNVTVKDKQLGEEIFAGSIASLKVDGEGNIDLTTNPEANVLTLHRQVSGTMGYFTSIPTLGTGYYVKYNETSSKYQYYDATTSNAVGDYSNDVSNLSLRLVASNISSSIILDNFNSDFTEANEDNSNALFVVNGVKANGNIDALKKAKFKDVNSDAEGYVLYTINLKDWFPNGDVNYDGLLDENDAENENNWNTPSFVQGASFKPGSVFAGEFLIPFVKVENNKTLQLQLFNGTDVIRTWNINLPQDDRQIYPSQGHAKVWNGAEEGSTFADNSIGETQDSYSLVRNHLYTIGSKETDDYNPGTDEPEDLSKGQNLILKVNDNWEMIHKMEVE